jgi:Copper type II ascorbate-dependent monooxygenase, C-terminal domain
VHWVHREMTARGLGARYATDSVLGMRAPRMAMLLVVVGLGIPAVMVPQAAMASSRSVQSVTTISMTMAHAYKPHAASGTTDDYHCTLVNPHVTRNAYIVSSQFVPGSDEDHHAALFLLPPALAATAEHDNNGGRGWTCFGLPLSSSDLAGIAGVPLLTFWAPGAGVDNYPKGTGVTLPAGSLVVMQVHYNLLVGDKAVKDSLVLHTVPASTPLLPLHLNLMLAPPDIPCPSGVTGPLCNRAASLANLGQRFGPIAVEEVNGIESICGHNRSDPPEGDSTSCVTSIGKNGYIVRVYAHMHLLGRSFKMVLDPGTPEARTVLNVPNFDFHDQRSYNLTTPIPVAAGEPVQVTCTYDPTLAQELPILRKAPPHFVTWGDGSTDEMCIGIAWTSSVLPNVHDSV